MTMEASLRRATMIVVSILLKCAACLNLLCHLGNSLEKGNHGEQRWYSSRNSTQTLLHASYLVGAYV